MVSAGDCQTGWMVRWSVEARPAGVLGTVVVGVIVVGTGTQASTGQVVPRGCIVYRFVGNENQARLHWNEMDPCFDQQLDHWMVGWYGMVSGPVWVLSGHLADQTSAVGCGSESAIITDHETARVSPMAFDAKKELYGYEVVSVIHRLFPQWLVRNTMDSGNTRIVSSDLTHQAIPGVDSIIIEPINGGIEHNRQKKQQRQSHLASPSPAVRQTPRQKAILLSSGLHRRDPRVLRAGQDQSGLP